MKKMWMMLWLCPLGLVAQSAPPQSPNQPSRMEEKIALVSPLTSLPPRTNAMTLAECFTATAVRNDQLAISMEEVRAAQARVGQAIAQLFPTIDAVNTQSWQDTSRTATARDYSSSTRLALSYPIFNGFKNYNQVGASQAGEEANRYSLKRNYQTLYQEVATAFYQILSNEGDLLVLADTVKALEDRVAELQRRVELGRSRPAELLQAQADLANTKVVVEQTKGVLAAARELMAFYLGKPSQQIALRDERAFPKAQTMETYLSMMGERPDVLAQVAATRQARRVLSATKGELWPEVTVSGGFGMARNPSSQAEWDLLVRIELPLFDGGLIISRIREQKSLARQSELNLQQLRRQADQQVRTTYQNFISSVAQFVQLEEATQLSQENYLAQKEDYLRGVVSNLDVLNALRQFQSARRDWHNADMNARLNLINLHVAAGQTVVDPQP